MLLYTKTITEENVTTRKVFGTTGNIPAESDKEVICKDASGKVLSVMPGDTYVDNGKGGVKRLSDGAAVNVYVVDAENNEVLVLASDMEAAAVANNEEPEEPDVPTVEPEETTDIEEDEEEEEA